MTVKPIKSDEVKQILQDKLKNKPEIQIDIEGNIIRVQIKTIYKRTFIGYMNGFVEIV